MPCVRWLRSSRKVPTRSSLAPLAIPGADELARLARPARGRNCRGQHARGGGERTFRFAVVTHMLHLTIRMALRAEEIGLGAHCVGVLATEGDPHRFDGDTR